MCKILIVEDDKALCEELAILLNNAGYTVSAIENFTDVIRQMRQADADLILLDITLPGNNGEMLLKEFRKTDETPVIMLTSSTGEIDEVLSMSFGADDYITKPYHPTILLLRISAVLKRSTKSGTSQNYHDAIFSSIKGSIKRNGQEEILTRNEMIIFQLLLDHVGEIVSQDSIMTALWDNEEYLNDNALFVNISRLRSKLAALGMQDAIETRKKQGYILR